MITRLGVALVLGLAAAWLFTLTVLQSQNTLQHNGNWISGKRELALGVVGAASFLVTRPALRFERLDPGEWHAYQETLSRERYRLRSLSADFAIEEPAYLTFIAWRTENGFEGVRLGRTTQFPSACLAGDIDGAFRQRVLLSHPPLDGAQHHIRLDLDEGAMRVWLDGKHVGDCVSEGTAEPGHFGVRGSGSKETWVDNLVVETSQGETLREDFSNREGEVTIFVLSALLVVAVLLGAAFAERRRARSAGTGTPRPDLAVLAASLFLLVVAALIWTADYYLLSKVHPDDIDFTGFVDTIESQEEVVARFQSVADEPKPPGTARLMVIGSSQTWGAGARRPEDTFVARLGRDLDAAAPPGSRVEAFSLSVSGRKASRLVKLFEEQGLRWSPDTVVVNLSNNDSKSLEKFADGLRRFIEITRQHGIHLVFVLEPNTIEKDRSGIAERHEVMKAVAREGNVPVLNVQDRLDELSDTGFLWWDRVHFTSYGQKVMADLLFDDREILLPKLFASASGAGPKD